MKLLNEEEVFDEVQLAAPALTEQVTSGALG